MAATLNVTAARQNSAAGVNRMRMPALPAVRRQGSMRPRPARLTSATGASFHRGSRATLAAMAIIASVAGTDRIPLVQGWEFVSTPAGAVAGPAALGAR